MSSIKKLAGQTAIYGLSTIVGRFLNIFLTFWLTYVYGAEQFAVFSLAYAYVTFLNVIYTYGMETAFFRFAQRPEYKDDVFPTAFISILFTTILFTMGLLSYAPQLAQLWQEPRHPEYVVWFALIIGFDTLSAIPFAQLRQQGRPIKYAAIKIAGIVVQVAITYFFISIAPQLLKKNPSSIWVILYKPSIGIGYAFLANLIASGVTLLLLSKEILSIRLRFNFQLWKEMLAYSWPLIIVGLGGMVNEVLNRIMLDHRLPYSFNRNRREIGIFNANLKVAALVNIFIQVFRMGAEPFFFNEAGKQDARRTYARVMKIFVIISCLVFLVVSLFAHTVWGRYFVGVKRHPEYAQGWDVIPISALAYIFLGIYYNLTVWYKLTNKTLYGAYITVAGAVLTVVLNYITIPYIGYWGAAWTTLLCYGFMMWASYTQGQKHYPIPYAKNKLIGYVVLSVLCYGVYYLIYRITESYWVHLIAASILFFAYILFIARTEKKELSKLPFIGRLYQPIVHI